MKIYLHFIPSSACYRMVMVQCPIADGLFDIFATTRLQFEHFITEGEFDMCAPILYYEDTALISQQQHRSGLGQDGTKTTTSVCDININA